MDEILKHMRHAADGMSLDQLNDYVEALEALTGQVMEVRRERDNAVAEAKGVVVLAGRLYEALARQGRLVDMKA